MTSQHYAQDQDHFRKQCKAAAEAMECRAQEIAAEHAAEQREKARKLGKSGYTQQFPSAQFPPETTMSEDNCEAIDMVLNDQASDTMRIAAFRSLPMDVARGLLDDLGVSSLREHLTGQKAYYDEAKRPADSLMAQARQANIEGLRNSVPRPKEDLTATPVTAPLEEALDITSDLSMRLAEEIDTLEAHLQSILGPENPEAECSTDPGWDNCSPAVARVRSLNSQLAHRLRDIISIRDRLEC